MNNTLGILLIGFFIIVGIILTIVGIVKMIGSKKRCTHRISATCVGIDTSENHDFEDDSYTTVYSPIYEIYHCGQMLRIKNPAYSGICHVQLGEQVELFINPNNPNEFLNAKGNVGIHGALILMGVLLIFTGTVLIPVYL